MDRRQLLKGLSTSPGALVVSRAPIAASTVDIVAATEKVGAVTAGISRLVGLLDYVQLVDKNSQLSLKALLRKTGDFYEEDADRHWYHYGLPAIWKNVFCKILHGNTNHNNPASKLNGLANIKLVDIDRDLLVSAFKHQGMVCTNLDQLMERIELARTHGLQTVGDLQQSIGRNLLTYIPEMMTNININIDNHDHRAKDRLSDINRALKALSTDFPSVFEGTEDLVAQIFEKQSAMQIADSIVSAPTRLSLAQRRAAKAKRAALAEVTRQKRRFSVRQEQTVFGWQNFKISWRKDEREPTHVQFHNLRLELCKPQDRADDSYRPKDIKIEFKDDRHLILSTRDTLLMKHLQRCASGDRALFPKL